MESKKISLRDKNTFNEVFNDFYPSLIFFANKFLNGEEEVSKDVVQDVFYRLLKNKKEFESMSNLKGYLYSSVKNSCFDYHKHNKVKQLFVEQNITKVASHDYSEIMLKEEAYRHLLNAIDRLPSRCKEIFILTLKGVQNNEVAELMGISTETVKSQKKRGKKMLATMLNHSGIRIWSPIIIMLAQMGYFYFSIQKA